MTPHLLHSAIEPTQRRALAPASLTDRARVAVVLQAASLLGHLRLAQLVLVEGWRDAEVDQGGILRAVRVGRGSRGVCVQDSLLELAGHLFDESKGQLSGKGPARRALRTLMADWRQSLTPLAPDEAVCQLFREAPFLWEPEFAAARGTLAAAHMGAAGGELWVAGPGPFRRAMLRGVSSLPELRAKLASSEAYDSFAAGGVGSGSASAVSTLIGTGRLQAAQRTLRRKAGSSGPGVLRDADTLGWLFASAGKRFDATDLSELAIRAEAQPEAPDVHLVAAQLAWDRGELQEGRRRLRLAEPVLTDPRKSWRWRQIAALLALEDREAERARTKLERALATSRRWLGSGSAAALWNDLAVARAAAGDLGGAERAAHKALWLLRRSHGSLQLSTALVNLAEVRIRSGRFPGVRAVLDRLSQENRRSGNLRAQLYDRELDCRYELACGRPERVVEKAEEALAEIERLECDGRRSALLALAARACGWLGRSDEAERYLAAGADPVGLLEPEEIPAFYALAGAFERARESASDEPFGRCWRAVLDGGGIGLAACAELEELGSYRAARAVADLELVRPGSVPIEVARRSEAQLESRRNDFLAEALRRSLGGPWRALENYCNGAVRDERELRRLLRTVGPAELSLTFERRGREQVVVPGRGGEELLQGEVDGGVLSLRAQRIGPVQRALFALARREWRPQRAPVPASRGNIVGESRTLLAALGRASRLATGDLPVLITGESGTGKELVARWIHRSSPRASRAFLPINSAAMAEQLVLSDLFGHVRGAFTGADRDRAGVFESARGGTVLLDEIGDLPLQAQAMLLRVLQEGEVRRLGESRTRQVDVRVLAATHRHLEKRVAQGRFRQDLFYRLAVGRVELPALRSRGDDLTLLIEHFLEVHAAGRRLELSPRALGRLRRHTWPGNVRELDHCLAVASALAEGDTIRVEHLTLPFERAPVDGGGYHQRVLDFRRRLVSEALEAAGGNQAAAARALGVSRQALSYLVRTLGLR